MRKTLILLMIVLVAFVSCAKKAVVKKVEDPGVLYVEGVDLMKQKKYDRAINVFAKLRETYPFDPMAMVAQVKQADAYFAKKDYQLAANTYEDFVNNYPEDESAPYAMKRVAESYEKDLPTIDRDQAIIYKAIERYTYLKNRYPTSPYAKDADVHLRSLHERLAAREFYVGEFYYKAGDYNASIMRLEYLLKKYPDAKDKEKALHYLSESYGKLDRADKAQQYRDILAREFPKSSYAGQAPKERKSRRNSDARPGPEKAAAVSKETPLVTAPASFTYEQRRKRDIPLVPLTSEPESSAEATVPSQSDDRPLLTAKKSGSAKDSAKTSGPNETRPKEPQATSGPSDASDSGNGANKDTGNKEEKKGSLGFFSGKGPIEINGDTGETLEKNTILIFKGNVIAKQIDPDPVQTFYLFCNTLTAYTTENTKEIDRLEASGNVKLVRHDQTATAKEAFYYKEKEGKAQIILKGDVVIFMGADKLSADTVTYYIDDDRFFVQGDKDKRAKATITPKK
jgi:outer membrane protein assembly factor BamD